MNKLVYISGALSDVPADIRPRYLEFYEAIGRLVESLELIAYVPHLNTDPVRHKHVTPAQVDLIDRTAVTSAELVIAVTDNPSFGVGEEIEIANHAAKPVVLLHQRNRLEQRLISRLIRGNPAVIAEIVFDDFADALIKLESFISSFLKERIKSILPESLK